MLPGPYNSTESRAAFSRLLAELDAAPHSSRKPDPDGVTVNEVLLAFLNHAEQHYRRADGSATHEVAEYKLTARYVRGLYGMTPAAEFGPLALKAVRRAFIDAGWCRSMVNQRVGRVRRMFKWAASEELISMAVHQSLTTVAGLQRGRSKVRESEPVRPVDDATVDATLPYLIRHVRGLVEFQRLTGCRPGEACLVRRCDIDTGGPVWLYKPRHHKTAWRGKARAIAVGPKAQALLREYFTADISDYLFSPRRAVEEVRAARAARRRTPRYPSHMRGNMAKRVQNPKRTPAEKYAVSSYGHAIAHACDRAFPPPDALAQHPDETRAKWRARLTDAQRDELKSWRKAHRWHPNQLRHTFATRVRKEHGLEHAGAALGHCKMSATEVYAERDAGLAATVASKIG
jgi:integrase